MEQANPIKVRPVVGLKMDPIPKGYFGEIGIDPLIRVQISTACVVVFLYHQKGQTWPYIVRGESDHLGTLFFEINKADNAKLQQIQTAAYKVACYDLEGGRLEFCYNDKDFPFLEIPIRKIKSRAEDGCLFLDIKKQ